MTSDSQSNSEQENSLVVPNNNTNKNELKNGTKLEEKTSPIKPPVTTVTTVTSVTSVTPVTPNSNYLPVTVVTCNTDLLRSLFSQETTERILQELILANKPLTTKFLADRLSKTEVNIRNAISRKREFFGTLGQKGQICYTYVLHPGIQEVEDRIKAKVAENNRYTEYLKKQEEVKKVAKTELENVQEFAQTFKPKREQNTLFLDYENLLTFDHKLADSFLENPIHFLELYESCFTGNYNIELLNLPTSICEPIERIRHEHLNKLIMIEGRITSIGEVKPIIMHIKYECPSCGTLISIAQNYRDGLVKEPSRCSCGRRGGFRVMEETKNNGCFLQLEDLQEKTDNPHSQRIKAIVFNRLTEPESIKKLSPGNEVRCFGIVKEVPIKKFGQKSLFLNWILEISSFELIEKEIDVSNFTEVEQAKVKELSKSINEKGMEEIVSSFAPDVFGYDKIKEALILQLCNKRNDPTNQSVKNKSNILLIGDPGTAKSVMCDFAVDITYGARKAVGGGSSAVGITASVVKEEETLGGYRVEPGAMVLAKELLFIDELNNLQEEDKPKLQEGMESMSVSVDKANLHVKMKVTGGIISAANPIGGHFTMSGEKSVEEQFNIPTPILNRFDSIFVITDSVDEVKDAKIAEKMIRRHRGKLSMNYDKEFLRKFFAFIRSQKEPEIDEEVEKIINKTYCLARQRNDSRVKLNARFLNGLTRMCVASAKLRLSSKVELKDIERCILILAETEYKVNPYILNNLK